MSRSRTKPTAAVLWVAVAYGCGSATMTPNQGTAANCGEPTFDAASPAGPAGVRQDGGSCMIAASDYDQSCRIDADCSLVAQGDYCTPGCLCQGAAINVGALLRFYADVEKTPVASDAMAPQAGCTCLAPGGPCCRGGTCQVGARCADSGCQ